MSEFGRLRSDLDAAAARLEYEAKQAETDRFDAYQAARNVKQELAVLDRDLQQASARASNIPADLSDLRDAICAGAGVRRDDLPFIGEQLAVADPAWEAAAEKLVRPFALSLVVADEHYRAVSAWIDAHPLGGMRLV